MRILVMFTITVIALITLYAIGSVEKPATASVASFDPVETVADVARTWDPNEKFRIPQGIAEVAAEKEKWALLRDIMECESNSRWVVVDVPGRGMDCGPAQINTYYHAEKAMDKGYDLRIPSENVLYSIELFEEYYPAIRSGKWSPWENTKACWTAIQEARSAQ